MRRCQTLTTVLLALSTLAAVPPQATKSLLTGTSYQATPGATVAKAPGEGLSVVLAPGDEAYPGIGFTPSQPWDISAFGHIEARIVNTGTRPLTIALRVDNAGDWKDNPWNTESLTLGPGEKGTLTTLFGYAYGRKPGFRLDPTKVVHVLVFTTKADRPRSFRIESLVAGGPPHETPPLTSDDVRAKPADGSLLGARTKIEGDGVAPWAMTYRARPEVGRWDLRDSTQVRVGVHNAGAKATTARVRLETNGGDTDWIESLPVAPGAEGEVVVPFARAIDLDRPETQKGITSDAVRAVAVGTKGEGQVEIRSIRAEAIVAKAPDWLGKRPPVPGVWTKTLDQEFDGTRLDPTVWKATGENYYDKTTHWAKDDVIVKDGLARLRYEKRTGFQNDDPKRNSTAYAAGYLDTYGLWAQRYGYFEARMQLPRAPGLWPAFWMMPDRGPSTGEQWKRQSTADGGMEFDIMEGLTRWGPHRYNIAMHYDGYEKDHKSLGSDKVYVETDQDGFVTCGLLWTPGLAVYYCNGREVLRWASPRVSNVPSILMFTLPMGGWDNDALDDARLPADLAIDYVRVWQRKDLATAPGK